MVLVVLFNVIVGIAKWMWIPCCQIGMWLLARGGVTDDFDKNDNLMMPNHVIKYKMTMTMTPDVIGNEMKESWQFGRQC